MPIKSKRASASDNVLQRIYEEAYRTFVDAMFEDGRGNGDAALDGWLNTLELIESQHSKIVACPQVSSLDITLYARIVDIERQSKDRVYAYAAAFSGNTLTSAELKTVYEQLRTDRRKTQNQEQQKQQPSPKPTARGKQQMMRPDGPLRSLSAGTTGSNGPNTLRSQSPPKKSMLMTLRGPKSSKKDNHAMSSSTKNRLAVPATTAANLAWTSSSGANGNASRRSSETNDQEEYAMQTTFKNFSSSSLPGSTLTSTAPVAAVAVASANTVPNPRRNLSMSSLFDNEHQSPLISFSPVGTPPSSSPELVQRQPQVVQGLIPSSSRSPSPMPQQHTGTSGRAISTPPRSLPSLPPRTVNDRPKPTTTQATTIAIDNDVSNTKPPPVALHQQSPTSDPGFMTPPTKPGKFARRKMLPEISLSPDQPLISMPALPTMSTSSSPPSLPPQFPPPPPPRSNVEYARNSATMGSPPTSSSDMPSAPLPIPESLTLPPSTFPYPQSSGKLSDRGASPMAATPKRTQKDPQPSKRRQGSAPTSPTPTGLAATSNPLTAALAATAKEEKKEKERKPHQPYGLTSSLSSQSDPGNRIPRRMSPTRASAARSKAAVVAHDPDRRQRQTLVPATSSSNATAPGGPLPPLLPHTPNPEHQAWNNRVNEAVKNITGVDETAARQILNEIVVKGDEVHWDDIAGLEQAKTSLKETVVYPFLRPDLFKGLREPARGMLLFGPPGTGKTMLARAVATESQSTFFAISASSLTSKYLGESEKLVRALFALARALAPSIIFVDEIDSLLSTRNDTGEHEASRRIKTEFLVKWSDLAHAAAGKEHKDGDDAQRVLVLAATNLPWAIDEAARRRFVRRQYIPLPEPETRKKQIETLLKYQVHDMSEGEIDTLVELTDGFSGSDITAVAKDAAMGPLRALGEALLSTPRDQIRPVKFIDFEASLKNIRPSVSKEGLQAFEDWALKYGSSGA
ncbi:hypothetical protein POJ06DRAFT_117491 [Lipomyces tetrasporus]|uniref:AAA+ ATPase domain-containing protein n=1 Tax=Lipomyces tetrasporus TaxID=54092 RepID=A0AAD7QU80_9ASCO|nr:uncharacterized protein POJ06DRAFT_117491 [Lipomyces tetrasporus]KAJ8099827.1 hypothetical protein POJ06DRAFT_117491 [Lipomyces tetrasporus]